MGPEEAADVLESSFAISVDGIAIRGFWHIKKGISDAPVLVILHGIPRAKPKPGDESYRRMSMRFAGQGFLSLAFNFRGTGISGGDIGMAGWSRDLEGVIDFARGLPGADPDRVVLLGFSAGGASAIHVAARDPAVCAVLSVSSPAEFTFLQKAMPSERWVELFREIGLIRSPDFPRSLEDWENEFAEISPLKWVDKISPRPVLIMHGEEDELIPCEQAEMIYQKAGEPREFLLAPGGKHRLRVDEQALDMIEAWLINWLKKNPKSEKT